MRFWTSDSSRITTKASHCPNVERDAAAVQSVPLINVTSYISELHNSFLNGLYFEEPKLVKNTSAGWWCDDDDDDDDIWLRFLLRLCICLVSAAQSQLTTYNCSGFDGTNTSRWFKTTTEQDLSQDHLLWIVREAEIRYLTFPYLYILCIQMGHTPWCLKHFTNQSIEKVERSPSLKLVQILSAN